MSCISVNEQVRNEAEAFVTAVRSGRMTFREAADTIRVPAHVRALLSEWIKTMPHKCRLPMTISGERISAFKRKDLIFRDRVWTKFLYLLRFHPL